MAAWRFMGSAGWTIAVIRRSGERTTVELWDCAVAKYQRAEAKVASLNRHGDVFLFRGVGALDQQALKRLGLESGEARRRK
jgi:hypothetical protein